MGWILEVSLVCLRQLLQAFRDGGCGLGKGVSPNDTILSQVNLMEKSTHICFANKFQWFLSLGTIYYVLKFMSVCVTSEVYTDFPSTVSLLFVSTA